MSKVVTLRPGEKLFSEGDPSGSLYHIKQGEVLVFREKDEVEVALETLHAGDFLGSVTIFTGEPRSASVRALSHVLLEAYDQETFHRSFEKSPAWMRGMIKDVITRLKRVNNTLVQTSISEQAAKKFQPTGFSLAANLCRIMKLATPVSGNSGSLSIQILQEEISHILLVRMDTLMALIGALSSSPLLQAKLSANTLTWQTDSETLQAITNRFEILHKNPNAQRLPASLLPCIAALSELPQPPAAGVLWQDLAFTLLKKSGITADMPLKESLEKINAIIPAPNQSNTLLYFPNKLKFEIHMEPLAQKVEALGGSIFSA